MVMENNRNDDADDDYDNDGNDYAVNSGDDENNASRQ
jgi:hypothetical protein